jgi:hypothetical protein
VTTPAAACPDIPSALIADSEPVFQSSALISGVPVPVFGDRVCWPAGCLPRPANRRPSQWKIDFPDTGTVWNLRLREVAFALLNTAHPSIRAAGVFRKADPMALSSVVLTTRKLSVLAAWAATRGLPHGLAAWSDEDFDTFLTDTRQRAAPSTLSQYVVSIRVLRDLASVLTHGGLDRDPWPGRTSADVAKASISDDLATPVIAPHAWWPLLRAAWAYVHTFAPDLLSLREQLEAQERTEEAAAADSPPRRMRPAEIDVLVARWLAEPANQVPVATRAYGRVRAGQPLWQPLSLLITSGARDTIFSSREGQHGARRQVPVMAAVAAGRVRPADPRERPPETGQGMQAAERAPRTREDTDRALARWLFQPGHVIPVRATGHHYSTIGAPGWDLLSRMVLGQRNPSMFGPGKTAGRQRRASVLAAIDAGHPTVLVGAGKGLGGGYQGLPIDCGGFAAVTRPDGTTGPWRDQITRTELGTELRMVRAACYIFIAALSMMRDSEIQEIGRDAIVSHYGSPAIRSRQVKHDRARSTHRWWITEPVAEAIQVLERLSRHPTHILVPMSTATSQERDTGITAAYDIDLFIETVNTSAARLGLEPVPEGRIRPHMFRRTMASIAAQEPDGQIALGLQLKHAARRALANRLTHGYGQRDPSWAKEMDSEFEQAAARRLIGLLRDRQTGNRIAVGPGAARLHDGLDAVLAATAGAEPRARALLADERTLTTLLRGQFADLHWGTLNHCLWNASTAECQNTLPEDQRGQGPLLGACQPARCRNSAVTARHLPIWLAEEQDLQRMLTEPRLGPARRESLQSRLADVKLITDSWQQDQPDPEGTTP